jgi:hypothetical protein
LRIAKIISRRLAETLGSESIFQTPHQHWEIGMQMRNSRDIGLTRYRFKVRGSDGAVFDTTVECYHAVEAFSAVRSVHGERLIALTSVERIG